MQQKQRFQIPLDYRGGDKHAHYVHYSELVSDG